VKSFFGDDEIQILQDFSALLSTHFYDPFSCFICGHNIKEFDIPFLCRRYIVNYLPLPIVMNITGHKPWQIHHLLDTLELWKFGDYKHYTSLDLLCHALSIESSKNEMSGKDVSRKYWEGEIEQIAHYCERDVVATAKVYLRCIGAHIFANEKIIFAQRI
jgi:DNA polymerase III epsilon subunit-like protein